MPHPPVRIHIECRNCGTPAPLNFCPECGQETAMHPPTLGEFLHEFIGHYVALEGALWRTLRMLITQPGRLTREYLEGRRRRYVLPLRLYLTCSFLFFLVLKLTPMATPEHTVVMGVSGKRVGTVAELQASANAAARAASAASGAVGAHRPIRERLRPIECGEWNQRECNFAEAFVNNTGAGFSEHPQETVAHMQAHMVAWAPYLVFLLLPVFAGIMMLTYRQRHMTYGEHVVFSLHLHAFWFLLLLGIEVLPDAVGSVLYLAVPVYGTWAMHVAYAGGRWWVTLVRAVFASVVYSIVLMLASVLGSIALLTIG